LVLGAWDAAFALKVILRARDIPHRGIMPSINQDQFPDKEIANLIELVSVTSQMLKEESFGFAFNTLCPVISAISLAGQRYTAPHDDLLAGRVNDGYLDRYFYAVGVIGVATMNAFDE
jgi:hypothetical protein